MYATQADIIERYSPDTLGAVAKRDENGDISTPAVERALADASGQIDSYLAARYSLPLATVPDILPRLCIDLALYQMAGDAAASSDLLRAKYKDALRALKDISSGKADLGLPTPPQAASGGAVLSGPPRRFSRDSMRGM